MKIEKITSKDNLKIKKLAKLQKKKKRQEYNLFVIENLRTIRDALRSGFKFNSLFITEEMLNSDNKRVNYIINNTKNYYIINDKINKIFSSLSTPSGISAVYGIMENKIDFSGNILYLNAISDPGNLGTIVRTAVAFGIKTVVLDEKCVDLYNQKVISASKDAIFKINIVYDRNCEVLDSIKREMKVYATTLDTENRIESLDSDEKKCIIFGNEANGVSEEVKERVDEFVSIKINKNMESLNVAISVGIVFYVMSKE